MARTFTTTMYSPGPEAIIRPIVNKLIENGRNINSLSRYERDLLRQNSSPAQFEEYTTPRVAPAPASTPAAQVEKYTPPTDWSQVALWVVSIAALVVVALDVLVWRA